MSPSSNYREDNKLAVKHHCVMNTTGPWRLIDLYSKLEEKEKEEVYLIPAKYVSPFDGFQAELFRLGEKDDELEEALNDAYAVHYFFSDWICCSEGRYFIR